MPDKDPFTQVHDALWELLEDNVGFTELVKEGNRIKFSGDERDPIKTQVQDADLPEVRIVVAGGTPALLNTTSSSKCTKRFQIQVSTGDQRVTAILFPLQWEIFRALSNWPAKLLALTWEGEQFVKRAALFDIAEGVTDADLLRNIKGWATLWLFETELWFKTSAILPPESES